jgi:hypothetical protein
MINPIFAYLRASGPRYNMYKWYAYISSETTLYVCALDKNDYAWTKETASLTGNDT